MKFDFDWKITFDTIIAMVAFLLALADLLIHLFKDRIRIVLSQDLKRPAYLLENGLGFFPVIVENHSSKPVTIAEYCIESPDHEWIQAQPFHGRDTLNPDGITLVKQPAAFPFHGLQINLNSENLLHHTRLEENDRISGYLVFTGLPAITEETFYRAYVRIGGRKYRTRLVLLPVSASGLVLSDTLLRP